MIAATARNTKGGKPKLAYWEGLSPTAIEGRPLGNDQSLPTIEADGKTKQGSFMVLWCIIKHLPNAATAIPDIARVRNLTIISSFPRKS